MKSIRFLFGLSAVALLGLSWLWVGLLTGYFFGAGWGFIAGLITLMVGNVWVGEGGAGPSAF